MRSIPSRPLSLLLKLRDLVHHCLAATTICDRNASALLEASEPRGLSIVMERCLFILSLVSLCCVLVFVWQINPWLALLALAACASVGSAILLSNWRRDAQHDPKTGLLNARAFSICFARACVHARRTRKPLSLTVIDLDCLKTINDVHGHMVGDAVLSAVGEIIRQHARRRGIAGRFGGDEFVLALPGITSDEARLLAEHIRLSVASARIRATGDIQTTRVTVSAGVAELTRTHQTSRDLFHAADMALLHAKRMGRDQTFTAMSVCPAEPDITTFLRRSSREPRFDAI